MEKEDLKKIIEENLFDKDNESINVNIYEDDIEDEEYIQKNIQKTTVYKDKFDDFLDNILSKEQESDENIHRTDIQAEMLINVDSGRQYSSLIRFRHLLKPVLTDSNNQLKYSINLISLKFLLTLFLKSSVDDFNRNDFIRHPRMDGNLFRINKRYVEIQKGTEIEDEKLCDADLYEVMIRRLIKPDFFVAKIQFPASYGLSAEDIKSDLLSFIFNINLKGIKLRPSEDWQDFLDLRNKHYSSMSIEDVKIPRKKYDENLLHLYSDANWSDNPFTQYMDYYQILENFFTEIPKRRLIKYIKDKITNPKFPYKDNNVLYGFGKEIAQLQEINKKEEGQLRETLSEFVENPNDLIEDDLKDYYKDEIPKFIDKRNKKDIIFDLNDNNTDKVIKNMCKRIYIVRNALVHNKSDRENNYDPSKHYSSLKREVPLIRAIAENAIIYSSEDYI
jgi:hypothetical protein